MHQAQGEGKKKTTNQPLNPEICLCLKQKSGGKGEENTVNMSTVHLRCWRKYFPIFMLLKTETQNERRISVESRIPCGMWNPVGTDGEEVGAGKYIFKTTRTHVSTRTANWAWKKPSSLQNCVVFLFRDLLGHPIEPELPSSAVHYFAHKGVEQIFCIQGRLINVFQTGCKFLIILLHRSSNGSLL